MFIGWMAIYALVIIGLVIISIISYYLTKGE